MVYTLTDINDTPTRKSVTQVGTGGNSNFSFSYFLYKFNSNLLVGAVVRATDIITLTPGPSSDTTKIHYEATFKFKWYITPFVFLIKSKLNNLALDAKHGMENWAEKEFWMLIIVESDIVWSELFVYFSIFYNQFIWNWLYPFNY